MHESEKVFFIVLGVCATLLLYSISLVVVAGRAEAYCLSKGFPKAQVTYNYETYCVGYEGVVQPTVVPTE